MQLKNLVLKLFFAAAVLIVAPGAFAAEFADLQQQILQLKTIRADFEQRKTIKAFGTEIVSFGQMVLSREHGLIWAQLKPFAVRMVITDERMVQEIPGQPAQVMSVADNASAFEFNRLVKALLAADISALKQDFTLELVSEGEKWQLRLIPRQEPFSRIFADLYLAGGAYIDRITVNDRQGDVTVITFSGQTHEPSDLSSDEKQAFNL